MKPAFRSLHEHATTKLALTFVNIDGKIDPKTVACRGLMKPWAIVDCMPPIKF